ESDRANDEINAPKSSKRAADRCREHNHHAVENPTDTPNKRFRLDRRNRRGKKIRGICSRPREDKLRPNIFEPDAAGRAAFMLLRREEQFVDGNAARTVRHARIDHQRAGEADGNFSARELDREAEADLHFVRRESQPEHQGLKRKSWDHLASILKK